MLTFSDNLATDRVYFVGYTEEFGTKEFDNKKVGFIMSATDSGTCYENENINPMPGIAISSVYEAVITPLTIANNALTTIQVDETNQLIS